MTLLLRVRTGSHLYGLNTPTSDEDWLEVHDHIKAQQAQVNSQDVTRLPLSKFMAVCNKGGHNGLEVMFADRDWPDIDLLADLRASFIADPYQAHLRFTKTAETMRALGTDKGARRAAMLLDWRSQIWETGRFDPHWSRMMRQS